MLPVPITVESMPQIMQMVPEHDIDLFAAVAAGPAATLTLVISDV
jgi:hypothetical protein